jgi:hypothetical protein
MSLRVASAVLLLWSAPALADLYRWLDPETGSVKFSSYPPPWYGDAEKEKRAPKVEHIPERQSTTATPVQVPGAGGLPEAAGSAAAPESSLASLEAIRKRFLLEFGSASTQKQLQSGGTALRKQLEGFAAVNAQLDRLDPAGADKRRAEAQPVLEKLIEGLRAAPPPPAASGSR